MTSPTERMRDAAYQRWCAESDTRRRLAGLVLRKGSTDRLGEVITIDPDRDDHLIEVPHRGAPSTWTTVVAGEASLFHHTSRDLALLHLLARRNDPSANDSLAAATYAARVLAIPDPDA